MAIAGQMGASVDKPANIPAHAFWFGEDQARYVIVATHGQGPEIVRRAEAAGVPLLKLGKTGGDRIVLPASGPSSWKSLRDRNETWLPIYMGATG